MNYFGELLEELQGELKGELLDELQGELLGELLDELQGELQGELQDELQDELQGELLDDVGWILEIKVELTLNLRYSGAFMAFSESFDQFICCTNVQFEKMFQ